jgi:hypothetical protein
MGLHKGDKVSWKSHGQRVYGSVEERITSRTSAAGRTVNASSESPQYRVRSVHTGQEAVHTEEALRRE